LYVRRVRATIVTVEKQWVLHILSVCVFVALTAQHPIILGHIVICGLARSTDYTLS
jgi:hypothetical protein